MKETIRKSLLEPARDNCLSAIVPELTINLPSGAVVAPALLSRRGDSFRLEAHLRVALPSEFRLDISGSQISSVKYSASGNVGGEIPFSCEVFRPAKIKSGVSGSPSIIFLETSALDLTPAGLDTLTTTELNELLESEPESLASAKKSSFFAHIIYHGPKLRVLTAGTQIDSSNEFVGEVTSSRLDTWAFDSELFSGALRLEGDELHLYLRSPDSGATLTSDQAIGLIESIEQIVGFSHAFIPWECYREVRYDHVVVECRLRPIFDLKCGVLPAVSRHGNFDQLIPCCAEGLAKIEPGIRERLSRLLWNVHLADQNATPLPTVLLIVCVALEGLMKAVLSMPEDSPANLTAKQLWRRAVESIGLNWKDWAEPLFLLWQREHRNRLGHGGLGFSVRHDSGHDLFDLSQLGGAFNVIFAAFCGYEGTIVSNHLQSEVSSIRSLMSEGD